MLPVALREKHLTLEKCMDLPRSWTTGQKAKAGKRQKHTPILNFWMSELSYRSVIYSHTIHVVIIVHKCWQLHTFASKWKRRKIADMVLILSKLMVHLNTAWSSSPELQPGLFCCPAWSCWDLSWVLSKCKAGASPLSNSPFLNDQQIMTTNVGKCDKILGQRM